MFLFTLEIACVLFSIRAYLVGFMPFSLIHFDVWPWFRFLRKLLTEDLPRLFVRPKKIVLDFQKGKAVGPVPNALTGEMQEGNKDFVGELSVTLVDARKLSYVFYGNSPSSLCSRWSLWLLMCVTHDWFQMFIWELISWKPVLNINFEYHLFHVEFIYLEGWWIGSPEYHLFLYL